MMLAFVLAALGVLLLLLLALDSPPRFLTAAALVAALAGCSSSTLDRPNLSVTATRATMAEVGAISVDIQPANLQGDLVYDEPSGQFRGTFVVPAGTQTITLTARGDPDHDGDVDTIGAGSAEVEVVAGKIASVYIEVLDIDPLPPVPDHAPMIATFTVSNSAPAVLEAVRIYAAAFDPDGDAIAYSWSFGCPGDWVASAPNVGYFAATQAGNCPVTVVATAKGLTDTLTYNLSVQATAASPGEDGSVVIDVGFLTSPYVSYVYVLGDGYFCALDRLGGNATCAQDATAGGAYQVWVATTWLPDGGTIDLTIDCGGTFELVGPGAVQAYTWTAPGVSSACMLTGSVTWKGTTDLFPIALFVR